MSATSQNPNQGQYYDDAGNIGYDGLNQYLYDGEGRICAVQMQIPGIGAAMTQYIYEGVPVDRSSSMGRDAEGNRVAKGTISTWSCDTGSNGFTPTTAYVLGPGGEQLSELTNSAGTWKWAHTNVYAGGQQIATYDADLSGQTEGWMYFHLTDWLGTRRQQTDYAGNPVLNFTGLPYGDGLTTIPVSGSAPDATEHHFTGKERDTESGNDYFGARYYASSMGRWMSPDTDFTLSSILPNPQRWNRYAYVINNPLGRIDPDGEKDKKFNAQAGDTPVTWNKAGFTKQYNCHSYAWYSQDGSGGWVNDPTTKVSAATQLGQDDPNQVGDRVIYYVDSNGDGKWGPGEEIVHSAVVTTVDSDGNTTEVTGKDGSYGVATNHPDADDYYKKGANGDPTKRAYFRIPPPQPAPPQPAPPQPAPPQPAPQPTPAPPPTPAPQPQPQKQ